MIRCGRDGLPLDEETAGALLVLPDAAGLVWVRERARDAAAVVVCSGVAAVEPGFPLPVLRPVVPGATAEEVSERLWRVLAVAMRRQLQDADKYAYLTARSLADSAGPGRLLSWIGRRHDARVSVHDGLVEDAWPQELRGAEEAEKQQVRQLVRGLVSGSVRLSSRGRHVQVWPMGAATPYTLLVAIRARPWSAPTQQTMQQVAMVVDGLLREQSMSAREARLKTVVEAARTSAFQFLLSGDDFTAARTIEPLAPGLFGAKEIQVGIAETALGEARTTLAAEVETVLGTNRAMPVLCPVEDGQVIVLWDASQGRVQSVLERVAQGVPGRAVGVSVQGPMKEAAMLYQTALASVPAARKEPSGVAVHDGRPVLEKLLEAVRAGMGATASRARRAGGTGCAGACGFPSRCAVTRWCGERRVRPT